MTAALPVRPPSRMRWWGVVALVYVTQLGLIFWLGQKGPPPVRPTRPGVQVHLLTTASSPLWALTDPTLFALPHRQSFSGPAWMNTPPFPLTNYVWSEPAFALDLPVARLGSTFHDPLLTNAFSFIETIAAARAEPRLPEVSFSGPVSRPSTWRLTDDLVARRLLTPFELRSWTSDDLLTNSVVQLAVDAQGRPASVALIPPGSGLKDADQEAITLAGTARFAPLPGNESARSADAISGLRWGYLIFEWQTLPVPMTNAATKGVP